MNKKQKNKRKSVLVENKIQFKYMLLVFSAIGLTALTVGISNFYIIKSVNQLFTWSFELQTIISKLNQMMIGQVLVLIVIGVGTSMILSHKIAGPIYRFRKSMAIISQGDFSHRISLRKHDEMQDLAQLFNQVVAKFERKDALLEKVRKLSLETVRELEKENFTPAVKEKIVSRFHDIEEQIKAGQRLETGNT